MSKTSTGADLLNENYERMLSIMNAIRIGIFITDGEGNVVMINEESAKSGGLRAEDVLGRNMKELQRIGYVDESSILKSIQTGEKVTMIQSTGDEEQLFVTCIPLYTEGKRDLMICTEQNVTELARLEKMLADSRKINEQQENELKLLRRHVLDKNSGVIANSRRMKQVMQTAGRIAEFDTTVLILGESGTGKEVVADYIYQRSNREGKPFIKVNCAAIPVNLLESELFGYEKGAFTGARSQGKMGYFEMANGGTLFLDEIGDLPMMMQAGLLRALQDREIRRVGGEKTIPVDVRIIAATNANLPELIRRGDFRKDLFYRLNTARIEIPALRHRREDIIPLTRFFLQIFCQKYQLQRKITPEGLRLLRSASWPGNVRELKNAIERLVITSDDEISQAQVQELLSTDFDLAEDNEDASLSQLLEECERAILSRYLKQCGTAAEAARRLKVNKSTISRKLHKYSLLDE